MKKIGFVVFAVLMLFAIPCFAQSTTGQTVPVNVAWTASTTAGARYNVYRESAQGACTATPPTGSTCTKLTSTSVAASPYVDNPTVGGAIYYVVRALSSNGIESVNAESPKVDLTQPGAPGGVTVTVTVTMTVKAP